MLMILCSRICAFYPWRWNGARDWKPNVRSRVAQATNWSMWPHLWWGEHPADSRHSVLLL